MLKTKVENFSYNGFCGKSLSGVAPYEAEFLEWTQDPGIAKCACSDGVTRLIPTFAFVSKEIYKMLPVQDYSNKQYFGAASHS